jgi:plasmid stabilization system protein ParE
VSQPRLFVKISSRAERELANILTWLKERNPTAAKEAEEAIANAIDMAAAFPMANRAARTEFERIKSLPKWHKIIIYKVEFDRIVIASIRDTRQEPPR